MATTPPHVLTLPREVRDLIYPYLHQDILFYWVQEHQDGPGNLPVECEVRLPEAPLLSVLLAHSRLKAEYMESTYFKKIRFIIRARHSFEWPRMWRLDVHCHTRSKRQMHPSTWPKIETALEHVRHVDVFYDCSDNPQEESFPVPEDSSGIRPIVKTVRRSAPSLATLRIAITYGMRCTHRRCNHSRKVDLTDFRAEEFLPPPPQSCVSLSLVQHAEGFFAEKDRECIDRNNSIRREGFKVGCYVYSLATTNILSWTFQDMVDDWKVRLKRQAYNRIPPWQCDGSVSVDGMPEPTLPEGFAAWKEKGGAMDAAVWYEKFCDVVAREL